MSPAGRLTPDDWQELSRRGLGLDLGSALYGAWHAAYSYFQRTQDSSAEVALMLWGSRFDRHYAHSTNPFYADLSRVARFRPHELQELYRDIPDYYATVMREWVVASGGSHAYTRDAAADRVAHIRNDELSKHPIVPYATLDYTMCERAQELASLVESDAVRRTRLAFYVFSALSRIAAYESFAGWVCWRSEWLRGKGANDRAIPGASSVSETLTRLLHTHVLDKRTGHWSGGNGQHPRAAIYRLRFAIRRGVWSREEFARNILCIKLDRRGAPLLSRG